MLRAVLTSVVVAVVAVVALLGGARDAHAETSSRVVDLYTIGPGDYLFARYGHSLLCVRDLHDAPAGQSGRCFDYGVPEREDVVHMAWTSVRGQPSFVPVMVDEKIALDVFRGQGRAIERQRLPLSPDEVSRLVDRMESDVRDRRSYAYHPYVANCTTQLRDRIDEATGGRLRPGRTTPLAMRFRDLAEEGSSGRLAELTALALFLGARNDRRPDPWEAMFLPAGLRDGVFERLGAAIERVEERQAVVLPTSRAVGRVMVFVVAILLAAAVRYAARRGRPKAGVVLVGFVLGTTACALDLVSALVVWPEIHENWALLLLLPTDLALPYLPRPWLVRYARARIAVAVALGVLELASVIAQPLLPIVALVALPLVAVLRAVRQPAAPRDAAAGRLSPAGQST